MQRIDQGSSLGLDADVYDVKTWEGNFAGAGREFVELVTKSQAEVHQRESKTPSDDDMTLESEDGELILKLDERFGVYEYYKDDKGALVALRTNKLDRVWNGWDAALIVSKLEKPHHAVVRDNYGKIVAEKEDIVKVFRPEECEIHLGKRKASETLEIVGRDATFRKVSQLLRAYQKKEEDHHLIESEKPKKEYSFDREVELHVLPATRGECKMQPQIALAVAALTVRGMFNAMYGLEEVLSKRAYEIVREIVFNLFAKFVLSVFDKEDFERFYNPKEMLDEYSTFFSSLYHCNCDPLTAVAEGRVEFDKFSTLREHDLCDVLRRYHENIEYTDMEVWPWIFPLFPVRWNNIRESDIASAMMEMEKYVPLKEGCKMQLTLELRRRKSYHILDTLILEALKDIEFEELFKYFADTASYEQSHSVEETVKEQAEDANRLLSYYATGIITGFYELATLKTDELEYFQEAVTFPLSHGEFGPCTDEVIEVIEIADHERRMQDERLISLHHILFGLSLSRVGDCVKRILSVMELKGLGGLPAKFSMFRIYKLSRDAANFLGENKVGLEHLVLAIVFDGQAWDAELLECLRNSDTECGVESWTDTDLYTEFLSYKCRDGEFVPQEHGERFLFCSDEAILLLVKQLRKAIESGRLKVLSSIRQKA